MGRILDISLVLRRREEDKSFYGEESLDRVSFGGAPMLQPLAGREIQERPERDGEWLQDVFELFGLFIGLTLTRSLMPSVGSIVEVPSTSRISSFGPTICVCGALFTSIVVWNGYR